MKQIDRHPKENIKEDVKNSLRPQDESELVEWLSR
jgi:hypothetical protein